MDPERWRRVKELFQTARELPAEAREEWLEEASAGDSELTREVRELLAADDAPEEFLAGPPAQAAARMIAEGAAGDSPEPEADLEGQMLGPYRVERRVGHGGIGAVYLATRDDAFRQRVAVKVIRRGMATAEVLARFRGERQILASIEHPHIARLIDGGATPDGRPYLVMEYIEGLPIDRYCDRHRLDLRRRLELFLGVCKAVEVAHRNLVVHRDIKPGNLLVTADGTPKLLDFGIAKILDPDLVDGLTLATRAGTRLLTPEFASPEQLAGERVTTASDLWSLGALLYLLLVGRTPFELGGASLGELARRVEEREPPRPSAAMAEGGEDRALRLAELRSTHPGELLRALRGDLDNIVLEALRREPERRYASAGALAADIRRHLADLPIEARPDTIGYRAGKFVRRHRAAVTATALAVVATLALVVTLAVQSARLARESARAERQAARATATADFLRGVLTTADPYRGMAHDATVIEALDEAATRIDGAFPGAPQIEAAVRHTVGMTYLRLGRYGDAAPHLERALALRRRPPAEGEPLVESLLGLGEHRQQLGRLEAADALYREALATAEGLEGSPHPLMATALGRLATARHDRGDRAGAETLYTRSLALRRQLYGPDHAEVATALDDLANLVHERGDLDGAEALYRQALEIRRRRLDPEHPDLSVSLNNVGILLHDRGRLEEAEVLYRESLDLARRRLGDEHPDVASSLNNLASLEHDRERLEEAEALYRESLEMNRRLFGAEHPRVAEALQNLAVLLEDQGRPGEAEDLYRQAIAIASGALEPGHETVAMTREGLAGMLADRGDLAGAERLLAESLAAGRQAGAGDRDLAIRLLRLAAPVAEAGRATEAAGLLEEALERVARAPAEPELGAEIRLALAGCLEEMGRREEARAHLEAAAVALERAGPEADESRREVAERLAALATATAAGGQGPGLETPR